MASSAPPSGDGDGGGLLPERWAFLTEVPKTSVGKFDKRALRTLYREGRIAVQRVEDRPAQPQAEEGATP